MEKWTPFATKEREEISVVANYLVRAKGLKHKRRQIKKLDFYIQLFNLFMLGLNRDDVQPTMPYNVGLLDQPLYEIEIWQIFLNEYIKYKSEKEKELSAKFKAPVQ